MSIDCMAGMSSLKVSNVIGAFLVMIHNGPHYYWGNMAIYLMSYSMSQDGSMSDQLQPGLTLSFYGPSWVASMLLSGYLVNLIDPRIVMSVALFILGGSFFVGYCLLNVSMTAFFITYGVLVGLGTGGSEGPLLQCYVTNLSKKHTALLFGIVLAGGPAGGVIISQFITLYCNPQNLTPDKSVGEMKFFTQEDVVDRIPSMLFIVGGVSMSLQFIGLTLLVKDTPEEKCVEHGLDSNTNGAPIACRESTCGSNGRVGNDNTPTGVSDDPVVVDSCTPWEMLKSGNFYKLVIVNSLGGSIRFVVLSYSKLFGQEFIHDDHFLTNLGTWQSLSGIPSTIFWSVVFGKIGVKATCVAMFSGMTLSSLLMFFTAYWNRWAYGLAAITASTMANLYLAINIAALKWFGKAHLARNVAMIEISSLLGFFLPGVIIDSLIEEYGYFSEFAYVSVCTCVSLLVVVFTFPRDST